MIGFLGQVYSQCCPESAWGALKNEKYDPLGTIETVDDLDIYYLGNSSKCIIWNYDIFGFDSGRTKQMVDFLAAHGYMAILPDYYRGTFVDPANTPPEETLAFLKEQTDWNGRLKEDVERVKNFGRNKGCERFGAIGK